MFYIDRFRLAHPLFDLGAMLADLMRFYLLRRKARPELYEAGRDAIFEAYGSGDDDPDLPFFVAVAMLLRLDRAARRPPGLRRVERRRRAVSGHRIVHVHGGRRTGPWTGHTRPR